jgi:hypothetical protein
MRIARSTPLRISGSPPLEISLVSAEPRPVSLLVDQFAGDQQAPGGGIHEQRRRFAQVLAPVAFADFVGNQAVGGGIVGNTQQCFCQTHQRHTLVRGQRKLVHQRIDTGGAGTFRTHRADQFMGQLLGLLNAAGVMVFTGRAAIARR